jgi:hypothetical protein
VKLLQAEAAIVDKPLRERQRRRKVQSEGIQLGDLNHHHLQSQNVRGESERLLEQKRRVEKHTF